MPDACVVFVRRSLTDVYLDYFTARKIGNVQFFAVGRQPGRPFDSDARSQQFGLSRSEIVIADFRIDPIGEIQAAPVAAQREAVVLSRTVEQLVATGVDMLSMR